MTAEQEAGREGERESVEGVDFCGDDNVCLLGYLTLHLPERMNRGCCD